MPVLLLTDVISHYGKVQALRGISLKVDHGDMVALLGANGAGKSTTLLNICGLVRTTSGSIRFDGAEVANLGVERIVRRGITQVLEGRELFGGLTTLENLKMGAYARRDGKKIDSDLDRMFGYFPVLAARKNQLAGTLSGGQQQMLAIGRALMARPRLLLLDEPSLGLAPIIVHEIFDIIRRINAEGTTILLVEQNSRIALSVASYAYVLELGKVTIEGKAQDLLENREVVRSYLGQEN